MILPLGPDPLSKLKSIPFELAIFLAKGLAITLFPLLIPDCTLALVYENVSGC
jgi:hypothetical protein